MPISTLRFVKCFNLKHFTILMSTEKASAVYMVEDKEDFDIWASAYVIGSRDACQHLFRCNYLTPSFGTE